MRKSPLNYLITVAIGIVLWVVIAIFIGGSFSESLMLAESTPEEFNANLRLILGIAALIGITNCLYWYYYGGLGSTAGNMEKAKKIWWTSLILQVLVTIVLLLVLVLLNLAEGILTTDWLIILGLISIHTWILFWFCTFFMSPRTVKNLPLFT